MMGTWGRFEGHEGTGWSGAARALRGGQARSLILSRRIVMAGRSGAQRGCWDEERTSTDFFRRRVTTFLEDLHQGRSRTGCPAAIPSLSSTSPTNAGDVGGRRRRERLARRRSCHNKRRLRPLPEGATAKSCPPPSSSGGASSSSEATVSFYIH